MAHFYGTMQGARGATSRLGHKGTGIRSTLASWSGAVSVTLYHDPKTGRDMFRVDQDSHHGAGIARPILCGVVGGSVEFLLTDADASADAATAENEESDNG